MKAAVWHGREDVRIEQVSEPPVPPRGQVQVQVAWCGICGTDLHEYAGGPVYIPVEHPHPLTGVQAPVQVGHEMSGTVIAVGDGVAEFKAGDRIAACPIVGCMECRWCRSGSMAQCDKVAFLGTSWTGGALAERLNLNAYQCYKLTDAISDEIGALVEPFSSTVRAVAQGGAGPSDNVAIVGAGPIGLMALMAARIQGAKRVVAVEVAERRIQAALECGADAVINPRHSDPEAQAREITGGDGFDVVLECAGQPASVLMAGKITRTRGRLVIMGVFEKPAALDLFDLVFREKIVSGSMSGYGLYNETIRIMSDPRFRGDLLISDRIGLDDLVAKGYHGLLHEKDRHVKILVRPV
ncbi:MAG: 2,3-butanediol dehydrogenase [Terracidiphilus sp.]|jgi:(R,R)-butanediol dehydrogenase/meso-butanediol dehydrogenase/diacetyl reductase